MGIASDLCFSLARRRVLKRNLGDAGSNPATFDANAYQDWRSNVLAEQFNDNFKIDDLIGRKVLDFGCGEGDLSLYLSQFELGSLTGVDVDQERVESAQLRCRKMQEAGAPIKTLPSYFVASTTTTIDLEDNSVDVLLCFDVLEHIMDYEAILAEWTRIIGPNGRALIWWVPWYHPFGPHIESLVPLPWAHAFFSDATLIETCARIYDMPEFKPRVWDCDEDGNKLPNKWKSMTTLPGVNRLTMAKFEKLCGRLGLKIDRREGHGFVSSPIPLATQALASLPWLREYFTSFVVYELTVDKDS